MMCPIDKWFLKNYKNYLQSPIWVRSGSMYSLWFDLCRNLQIHHCAVFTKQDSWFHTVQLRDPGVSPKLDTVSRYLWEQKYSVIKEKIVRISFISVKLWEGVTLAFSISTCIFSFCVLVVWLGLWATWNMKEILISSDTCTSRSGQIGDSVLTVS